jgi:hypothetical protein
MALIFLVHFAFFFLIIVQIIFIRLDLILFQLFLFFLTKPSGLTFKASQNCLTRIRVGIFPLIRTTLGAEWLWPVEIIELAATLKTSIATSKLAFVQHTSLCRACGALQNRRPITGWSQLSQLRPGGLPKFDIQSLSDFLLKQDSAMIALFLFACKPGEELEPTVDVVVDGLQKSTDVESSRPRSCVSGKGNIYVVWQDTRHDDSPNNEDVKTDIFFNSSSDGGISWLPSAIQINNSQASASNPTIACVGETVYVAWEDERDGELAYHNIYADVSTDAGRTFRDTDILLDGDIDGEAMSLGPQLFATGDRAYVVWFDQINGAYDIFLQATNNKGQGWLETPTRVDSDEEGSAYSANPQVTADGGSGVVVTWEDRRDGQSDIYANFSGDSGESFGRDIRLDTGDQPGSFNSFLPKISLGGSGVWVVWHDERNGSADIYMSHSADWGATWSAEAIRVDSDTAGVASSLNPVVMATGGGAGIAWQDNRLGGNDILFRFSPDGGASWVASEVRLDTDPGGSAQSLNPIITAVNNDFIVAWMEYRNDGKGEGNNDIFYNFSSDAGASWSNSDLRINSNTPGNTYVTDLNISIHQGDLLSTWADGRSGATRVYYTGLNVGQESVYIEAGE